MGFAQDIQDLERLRKILVVVIGEGLGYYVAKARLRSHLSLRQKLKVHLPIKDQKRQAQRFRSACEKLGPTFVKLGQLLSLRPDLVPTVYSEEFAKLQDHVPSFPFRSAQKIIEEDFGEPIKRLFKSFEKKPFASASIAQVHKATLKDGTSVAVKIRRPGIEKVINTDLDILFYIAESLEKHSPKLRNYRPLDVVKEFALWTRREINLQYELENAKHLRSELKNNTSVIVPKVYPKLSSKRVLTMDFVRAEKINSPVFRKKPAAQRKKLAMTYFLSILEQSLLHGLFHADPHPANIFVNAQGKLIFLDFGIMGQLSAADRKKIIRFILAVQEQNIEKSLNTIVSLAKQVDPARVEEFKKKTLKILGDVYDSSVGEKSVAHALYKIIGEGAEFGVVFDPNHVLMAKALYQAEGLCMELDPSFKVKDGLEKFAKYYMHEKYSPHKIASKLKKTLWMNKDLLLELPDHLIKLITRLEQDPHEESMRLQEQERRRLEEMEKLEARIEERSTQHSVGLAVLVLLIGALFFFYIEGHETLLGFPISSVLFLSSIMLLLYFIFFHHRHTRSFKQN